MAWIKRGSVMIDIRSVERIGRSNGGKMRARIEGWINEGVIQFPPFNTYWFYDWIKRAKLEWIFKRHPDMLIYEGTPPAVDFLYERLCRWINASSFQVFDVDYEIGLYMQKEHEALRRK